MTDSTTPPFPFAESDSLLIVNDGARMSWVNGSAAAATMVPAFRENLGPAEAVQRMLELYWVRPLLVDDLTTRRIDHVRCEAGYVDATSAFHRSVEECLVLRGSLTLHGEGPLRAGDYFWRPAGFVHSAESAEGFEAILMMEGESPGDASGKVTREVRPPSETGSNALHPEDWSRAIGPRGWPRRVDTTLLAAGPAPDPLLPANATARCLSSNPWTGAGSYLVHLDPGSEAAGGGATEQERIVVLLAGDLEIADRVLAADALLRVPAGSAAPSLRCREGAELLFKLGCDRR